MAITLATPYQTGGVPAGTYSYSGTFTVSSGNLLMACFGHDRDSTITSASWNSVAMTKWAEYAHPTSGWKSITVYALKSFATGSYTFSFAVSGGYDSAFFMLNSWSGVNTYKNVDVTGNEAIRGASSWMTSSFSTNPDDVAIMLSRTQGGYLSPQSNSFCKYFNSSYPVVQGIYTTATSTTTSLGQQMGVDSLDYYSDCVGLVMTPATSVPTTNSKMLDPIWF